MRISRLLLLTGVLVPAALNAQRSGMGRGGGRRQQPPDLRTKDLEQLNPAKIALDRRKDLELTADQVRRLDSLSRVYEAEAKNFGKALDTLQGIMQSATRSLRNNPQVNGANTMRDRPKSAKDSVERARRDGIDQSKADKDQERYTTAKNALGSTLLRIREAYDA